MTKQQNTELAFESSIFDTLKLAAHILFYDPRFAVRAMRLLRRQQKAAMIRAAHKIAEIHVPPFSIFSITGKCNLKCRGCYATVLHKSDRPELSSKEPRGKLRGIERQNFTSLSGVNPHVAA